MKTSTKTGKSFKYVEQGRSKGSRGHRASGRGPTHPEVVEALSRERDIPHNMMFMGSVMHTQSLSIQDLGGPDYLVTETSPAYL